MEGRQGKKDNGREIREERQWKGDKGRKTMKGDKRKSHKIEVFSQVIQFGVDIP